MKKQLAIFFLVLLFAMPIVHAVVPDETFSEVENRPLAARPELAASSVFSGRYMDELERYLSDQFPARAKWVGVRASLLHALGVREFHDTIVADGVYYQRFALAEDTFSFAERIEPLSTLMILPTKATFWDGAARTGLPDERAALGKLPTIDVVPALSRATKAYYDSDHHLTSEGAYAAYLAYCEAEGLTPVARYDETTVPDFHGSLEAQSGLPSDGEDFSYVCFPEGTRVDYDDEGPADGLDLTKLAHRDKYAVYLSGNHGHLTIHGAGEGTLTVVKDSFANAILPYLAAHYETIEVYDPRYMRTKVSLTGDVLVLYNLKNFTEDHALRKFF